MDLLGVRAAVGFEKHTNTRSARIQTGGRAGERLWQVFEFINDNLGFVFERFPRGPQNIQIHAHGLRSMGRYSGGENVFGHGSGLRIDIRPPVGTEIHALRFPMEGVRECAGWHRKTRCIFGDVERLDYVLGIFGTALTPTRNFDVHFTVALAGAGIVPSEDTEDGGGFELGRVANDKGIGSVAQAAGESDLSAGPIGRGFGNAKVQRSAGIGPRVRRIVIILSPAAAGSAANSPLVVTELNGLGNMKSGIGTFDRGDGHNAAAFSRDFGERGRGMKSGLDKHGGIFGPEMRGVGPGRVVTNGGERFVEDGLNPPFTAFGVQHQL